MEEPKDRNNSKDISRPIELDLDFLMPSNISESSNRQCLKLSKTNLEVLKIPLSTFWNLKVLDISSNKFTEFPLQVFNVPSLQELNIGHNLLSTIPIDINTLTNLTILKVNDNRFEEFPTHVCDIPALQIFDISGNKIRIIPSSVSKMDSLKTLHIQKNMIDVLPGALCDLYELEYLDMRANHLCTIPKSIRRLTRLQTLNISHNQISAFPTSLCSLFSLENLDIGQNKIDRIPFEIKEIDELKTLKISSNKLIEFPVELCHCEKLETLHIADNNISSIPPDIANLQTLKIFDIRHNRVSCLPYQLLHVKALTELYVIPNPLTQPPEAVCQNGKGAIFRYLREVRERKAIVVNRLQLNLLGVTGSGKSSLSRSLQRRESSLTAEADRTQVIERGSWEPDSKVAFNINDFGGHDVYRVGYPIFLHKNGVAIITFNLSQYQCEDNYYMKHIGEWIQTAQCRAPGIYIIIVGTHHDLVGDRDPDMLCQDVRHRFKQQADWNMEWLQNGVDAHAFQGRRVSYFSNSHVDIFTISSADMFGMENLSAYLVQIAKERGVVLPEAWVDVMNEIERMKFEPTTNTLTEGAVREIVKVEVARRKKNSARQADVSLEEEKGNQISRIVRRMMCCTSLFHEEVEEINQVASGPQTPHEDDEDISPAQVAYVVQDVLDYMSNTGEVVWFNSNTALGKVIFHKPEVLINLLNSVLHHDFEVKKKTLKDNYTKQKFEEIEDNLEMRGIIDEDVMEFLWQSFGVPGIERDAMIELMTKLDLSYFVDGGSVAKRTGAFHFPCLLQQNEPCDLESSGKWPARLPWGVLQLTLQIHTPHRCPSDVFEKLSVRIHKYLHMFDRRRIDWNNGVYAVTSRCKILLTRHSEERDWVITTNVRGKDRLAMWDILLKLHQDLVDILKNDWPGVFYSKHLMCPHCIEEGIPSPTLFPGDILDQPDYVPRVKVLPCRNAPSQTISATHVYPALAGRDGVLKENKDRLRRNRVTLVQSVTEQCLLEVLNSLTAQAIFLPREKENIMKIATQQERVEEFLDILKNKEDRAFYIFHKHLESSGQTHLADLLRPREEIMDELPSGEIVYWV